MRRRGAKALSLCLVGGLALSACGLLPGRGGDRQENEETSAETTEHEAAGEADFPYTKHGRIFTEGGDDTEVELSITRLETTDEYMMLEYGFNILTPLEGEVTSVSSPIRLVDPISGLVYEQYADPDDPEQAAFGSYFDDSEWMPIHEGSPQMYRRFFPPVPDHITHLTFTGSGMGAMTGVPVEHVDTLTEQPEPNIYDYIDPDSWEFLQDIPAGEEMWYPYTEPEGDYWDAPVAMESMVDDEILSVTRAGTEETIALNADVAFDFDESDLTDDAEDTLAELGEYMRDNLDSGGTITVVGHTDGVGDDDYNRDLSEDRAESVRDILAAEMGDDYEFSIEGRGSSEPLATEGEDDDEEARARNRRVEFSYDLPFDQVVEQELDLSAGAVQRNVGENAAFLPDDGEPHATIEDGDVQLNVYPLLRDGAYVFGVVGFSNTGTDPVEPDLGNEAARLPGQPDQFSEGTLGGFQLIESDDVRRSVVQLRYEDDTYESFAEEVYELHPGEEYRTIAVFAAPDESVTELTLHAGAFGEVEGVPIR